MKVLKECPILIGIVVVTIVISIISLAFKDSVYEDYADSVANFKTPVLTLAFKGAMDGVFPWNYAKDKTDQYRVDENGASVSDGEVTDNGTKGQNAENPSEQADVALAEGENAATDDTSFAQVSGNSLSGNSVSGNEVQEPEVYEFTEVDDEYFTDALFIGDSRTVGLSEYCEELDTRATFYSKVSLTIFDVMKKEFIRTDDGKIGVEQALSENSFGKIYIMLGLNEIGTGDAEYFKNAYAEVLGKIRELQPDAIIYIQGIMHVTAHKSDRDNYFNNDRINERNAAISELADQQNVFYIDMNEAVDDEDGNLDSTLSFDDVHLKASSYERWHQFLLHNAIVK